MRSLFLGAVLAVALPCLTAVAAEVELRLHQFLPAQANVPANFLQPWADKVERESGGRIHVQMFPAMTLGGSPASLYEQVRDGTVDLVWTLPGYTPGVFPKTETFELPFMTGSAEAGSRALWAFYRKHLTDEFADVHVLALHVHGPGAIHVRGKGVASLADMKGLKLRAPSRVIAALLGTLGATAIGLPVPAVPEALSKGVIDGAVVPWEVTPSLRLAELTDSSTIFDGPTGLYTATFLFAMNEDRYEALPADLRAVIDANSGEAASRWAGQVEDAGDAPGIAAAKAHGNGILHISAADTQSWKAAAQVSTDRWVAEMNGRGLDGAGLLADARALIAQYAR